MKVTASSFNPTFTSSPCTTQSQGKGGSAMFIQYPPPKVKGSQGDNILLAFAANGTEEDDLIIIQGPNPTTGSKKLREIFVNRRVQKDPEELFKDNFTVNFAWSEGITVVNLTIPDLQSGDEGTYKLSVAFLIGPDINVTMNVLIGPNDGVKVNTTANPQTTSGSNVNTTELTGSTSGGGLPDWAAILIGIVFAIIIAIVIIVYKRRNSGPPPQALPRYDPVNNRDRDRHGNGVMQGHRS
ncbi:uncharacterized protein [Branchiostoma lanceolatum]|uniref:uncharacterized protein isoform X2 n=1 Tax=Branchiostoma lanceolatum TaxID=7740 RepID=UPI003453F6E3